MARNRYLDDEDDKFGIDKNLLRRLFKYILPHKKQFIGGFSLLSISVLLSLIWPQTTSWIIDHVLTEGGDHFGNYKIGILITGILGAVLLLDVFLAAWRVVIITRLGHNAIYDIRKELFEHLQTLSFKYFDDRPAGKILVRVTSYVDALANLLSNSLIQLLIDVLTLVCILVIMLIMNPKLTLVSFVVLMPLGVFLMYYRKHLTKKMRVTRNKVSNRTAYMHENIMGVYVTQAFDREEYNHTEFHRLNTDVTVAWIKQILFGNTLWPAVDFFSTAGTILVYLLGYQMILSPTDPFTLGELVAFTAYLGRFWQPIFSFSVIYGQFAEATSNIERVFETMDTKPDVEDEKDAIDLPPITGTVDFRNVTFSYDGKVNVLENLSFHVEPGQTIALVGPTGAGKTTVVNLLSRFYDTTAGQVLIDGYDVRNITTHSLRTQVGVMMQDSFIFSGNIIDNIRYGRPEATDEECIAAAQEVYASEFIEQLPQGYYTKVEERGAGLSTGERQLLSFARAVLADPRILILDEATSSIDTQTELLIQRALAKLLANRTSFVIAHRLSTIKRADVIMCIANKGIAEAGNHDQLMQQKGIYYELNRSQRSALQEQ